eukprot:CAMPEP_0177200850 /NCGR_PEP_ID=MMETSP0367-20130122/26441_1 /TAXON_ID=447022 ORGANISM="Scrippsiella hangoei-like, Strain SHHI-4" /NCGR_SAMPLE_ID=MMETSP0367 /ASSEMBLY_ACC=CAM_ASM_000362 /LENGTH=95 /DNA_ID=CAMNT_0018649321 /DNA_START=1667 /DNA_END=1955 /DNA_ORIENTATION=+
MLEYWVIERNDFHKDPPPAYLCAYAYEHQPMPEVLERCPVAVSEKIGLAVSQEYPQQGQNLPAVFNATAGVELATITTAGKGGMGGTTTLQGDGA